MPHPVSSISHPVRPFFNGHEQTPPGHACGPGIWPHYLLHFILSGKGTFSSAGRTWRLGPGSAFLIIPGVVSSYSSDTDAPWEYCWVGFDGKDAETILDSCGLSENSPIFCAADEKSSASMGSCLLSLNDALQNDAANLWLHLSLLYRFFSMLSSCPGSLSRDPDSCLETALDYIRHNYAYDITIEDVARRAGVDRTWLYRLFRRQLNTSPQQYLIRYRLQMAKQLLSSSSLRISEIANSCGFADNASFCRHFRAQFSITPSQFRRSPGTVPVE